MDSRGRRQMDASHPPGSFPAEIKKSSIPGLQTQRRKTNCPTRYHSDFMNDFTHSADTDLRPYILPLITAGNPSASTLSCINKRFGTAAPRRVPDVLSAVSHQPAALCIQVRMYYSSSTHFLISLPTIITKTIAVVKQEFFQKPPARR